MLLYSIILLIILIYNHKALKVTLQNLKLKLQEIIKSGNIVIFTISKKTNNNKQKPDILR
jgi:hypothetical protein